MKNEENLVREVFSNIVKPRPQTPKPQTQKPKTKGPWADTKISWATTPPHPRKDQMQVSHVEKNMVDYSMSFLSLYT